MIGRNHLKDIWILDNCIKNKLTNEDVTSCYSSFARSWSITIYCTCSFKLELLCMVEIVFQMKNRNVIFQNSVSVFPLKGDQTQSSSLPDYLLAQGGSVVVHSYTIQTSVQLLTFITLMFCIQTTYPRVC